MVRTLIALAALCFVAITAVKADGDTTVTTKVFFDIAIGGKPAGVLTTPVLDYADHVSAALFETVASISC